ncbi:hypothetical protein ACV35H_32875, partial [Pseudomonas aeruginosa]
LLAALAGACALLFQLAEGLPLFIALSVLYGAFWTSVLPLTESYLLKRDKAAQGRGEDEGQRTDCAYPPVVLQGGL